MTVGLYKEIIDSAMEGIGLVDQNEVIQFANAAFAAIFEVGSPDDLIGMNILDFLFDDQKRFVQDQTEKRRQGQNSQYELQIITAKGNRKAILVSISPRYEDSQFAGAIGMVFDITSRKKTEAALGRLEKFESIALLANGIAHDCNNLLASVIGNISLAKQDTDPRSDLYQILSDAEKATERTIVITNRLLWFAKSDDTARTKSSIKNIIEEAVKFSLHGAKIDCKMDIPETLHLVEVCENQFFRVISNLIINARQAMPDGGTVKIKCENVSRIENDNLIKPGDYVSISISDGGTGIPDNILSKIFDPFFSTKPDGTGLGLANSLSIIKNYGGRIEVESEKNIGTTFTIILPAAEVLDHKDSKSEVNPVKYKGRILVVDDEQDIRALVNAMLGVLGYEACQAVDCSEAVERYRQNFSDGLKFDAVILDLTLPGKKGGVEILKEILDIDPKVNAIIFSGYLNDPVMTEFEKYGFRGRLMKPFKVNDLDRILSQTLTDESVSGL